MKEDQTRFWAALLTGAGLLIASLCGLCTLGGIGIGVMSALDEHDQSGYGPAIAMMALMIGAVPILVGVGLYFWGRALGRKRSDS